MQTSPDVPSYIASSPPKARAKMRELRKIIKSVVPKAEEKISYGMPYYGYRGRLAYFAAAKNHVGLYIPPPILQQYKDDLKGYVTAKAAVQFPLDKPLPVGLIKKLVTARKKWNEKSEAKKSRK